MKTPRTKAGRLEQRQAELDHLASQGWQIETIPNTSAILCRFNHPTGKAESKVFKGTSCKPHWWYLHGSIERRETFIESRLEDLKTVAPKTSRKSPDASEHFMVGEVLYDSWGYDQTNIDWFQVTKVKGKSIWLRPICENSSDAGNCSDGYTQPRRNEFCGEEFRKTVQPGGYVSSALRGSLYKWDGKPKYCSTYH